jgi:serine/threonine-protein kinase
VAAADEEDVVMLPPPVTPEGELPAVAGYRLIRELGRGGMGVVYLAEDERDGTEVALKTIVPAVAANKVQVERFLREARILRQLRHPNVVSFRDTGESSGRLFFAMDYVAGTDASQLLKRNGPLPINLAVRIAGQVLQALTYAHVKGFVHRDIKPANVLVADDGGRPVVRVADFGLARVYQASQLSGLTLTGEVGGTPAFMPPEQVTNYREARPPADQYAVAATLYNLLTCKHLFDKPRDAWDALAQILEKQPVPLRERRPDVPAGLARAVHRALRKDPTERFVNVEALREAILPFA